MKPSALGLERPPTTSGQHGERAVGVVSVELDHDIVRVGVEAIPDELDDRLDRVVLVSAFWTRSSQASKQDT